MNTPPLGIPLWARDLYKALEKHFDEDRMLFSGLQRGQAELQTETGKQTVMLVEIQRDLSERRGLDHKRAATEIELAGKTRGWIRKGLIGLGFAALGMLLHWLAVKAGIL